MARNRKHQSAAIHFGPVLKVMLFCFLLGGAAMGYVWQKNQIHELGGKKGEKEEELERLLRANRQLQRQLAFMQTPRMLEARVRDLDLGLVRPAPEQVVILPEPDRVDAERRREARYAQRNGSREGASSNRYYGKEGP